MTNLMPMLDPRRSERRPLVLFLALMAIVGLACILSLALASLGRRGEAAPERAFEAAAFFPPESALPGDYYVEQAPTWVGDRRDEPGWDITNARYIAHGDFDGGMSIDVIRENYLPAAQRRYESEIILLEESRVASQIDVDFQSSRAQQSLSGCEPQERIGTFDDRWLQCHYVARYDEFTVHLIAGIGPDRMSLAEFETLLRAYDALAVDLLGPTPTP
jgi:hypothetical protein